jgi:hypothetical protein
MYFGTPPLCQDIKSSTDLMVCFRSNTITERARACSQKRTDALTRKTSCGRSWRYWDQSSKLAAESPHVTTGVFNGHCVHRTECQNFIIFHQALKTWSSVEYTDLDTAILRVFSMPGKSIMFRRGSSLIHGRSPGHGIVMHVSSSYPVVIKPSQGNSVLLFIHDINW